MRENGVVAREVVLRCKDKRGVVTYNAAGIPEYFRTVCRNRECCERREGFYAVHVFTLYCEPDQEPSECRLGEYETVYEAQRPVSELIAILETRRRT